MQKLSCFCNCAAGKQSNDEVEQLVLGRLLKRVAVIQETFPPVVSLLSLSKEINASNTGAEGKKC